MLQIRLHRTGKTNRPFFRVVVAEHRRAAQGPYVSALGFWDPIAKKLKLNEEELKTWMDRGAKPSDRMSRLLTKEGMKHKHITIHERPARGPKEKVAASGAVEEEKKRTMSDVAELKKEEKPSESSEVSETPKEQLAKEETTPAVEGEKQENQIKSS